MHGRLDNRVEERRSARCAAPAWPECNGGVRDPCPPITHRH
ncbi:hypothetical protein LA76x_1419 [Lysobacter antibioticus]|uniref:Uncharacterized protein n=1 Tax=Lysobacter antibioticus TaxID=84531 RepID=A0A0S2F7P7_LYSAN|nr:hypothetical protein LA76x_1419 [Lysobacter antibioticus]